VPADVFEQLFHEPHANRIFASAEGAVPRYGTGMKKRRSAQGWTCTNK
jgi:hypothetical protein